MWHPWVQHRSRRLRGAKSRRRRWKYCKWRKKSGFYFRSGRRFIKVRFQEQAGIFSAGRKMFECHRAWWPCRGNCDDKQSGAVRPNVCWILLGVIFCWWRLECNGRTRISQYRTAEDRRVEKLEQHCYQQVISFRWNPSDFQLSGAASRMCQSVRECKSSTCAANPGFKSIRIIFETKLSKLGYVRELEATENLNSCSLPIVFDNI